MPPPREVEPLPVPPPPAPLPLPVPEPPAFPLLPGEGGGIREARERLRGPRSVAKVKRLYRPFFGGSEVWYDPLYQPPSGAAAYSTWMFRCAKHPQCARARTTVAANTARHGRIEPLAFLHAWLDLPDQAGVPHAAQRVDKALVDAYASDADKKRGYDACCDEWGAPHV